MMTTDMTLMHLMCAKICHDISAPAGAVTMGLEMLAQAPQDKPTLDLVTQSALSATTKLEMFRCLTGFTGLTNKPTAIDIERTLKAYWPDNKISIAWRAANLDTIQGPPARLLLAIILSAADGLPRGGTLTVEPNLSITAEGPTALLREETVSALTGKTSLSQQTANTVVPFFACTLAQQLGGKLHIKILAENKFQIQTSD